MLKRIATKLKNSDGQSYDRTFIGYYLPDMKLNSGYWATTHFNPNLEIQILGLTVEQALAARAHCRLFDGSDPEWRDPRIRKGTGT